jgi:opacity protein-like surface antigen
MAGASYDLTPQIKVETSYRYLNMGSGQSGAISCAPATGACAQQAQQVGLGSHDVRIGLRYAIASGSSKD